MRYLIPLLALVPLAAACSDKDDDGLRANTESIDSSSSDGESASGSGGQGDGSGDGDVIGTAKSSPESAGGAIVPMRIDVLRLERDGELVQLDIALVNDSDSVAFMIDNAFADRSNEDPRGEIFEYRSDVSNIGLIDGAEQKVFLPVFDSERVCVCTSDLGATEVQPGETFHLVATYGGVPDSVDELDVSVPDFPVITGVPLG